MSETQYLIYRSLFNECNEDFWDLPDKTREAFFDILYAK